MKKQLRNEKRIEKSRLNAKNAEKKSSKDDSWNFDCAGDPCEIAVTVFAAAFYREQAPKRAKFALDMKAQNIKC
jgi:hypothetical protein